MSLRRLLLTQRRGGRRARVLLVACLGALTVLRVLHGQVVQRDAPAAKPQVGTARLTGRVVVNDATGDPIRRVILLLNGGDLLIARQTTTDDEGRFSFSSLPAGRYTVQGWRNGFVRDYYGNKRPGMGSGSSIIVAEGHQVAITMKMTRSAAITGTLLSGGSTVGPLVRIQAFQYQIVAGERVLVPSFSGGVSPNGGVPGLVDDRGVFRLYGLAPGEYAIAASSFANAGGPDIRPMQPEDVQWALAQFQSRPGAAPPAPPPPAPPVTYAPVFYPGTTDATAITTITVGPGEERGGIDFALQLVPVVKVSGMVLDADGQTPRSPQVSLMPAGGSPIRSMVQVRVTPDGKFSASGVSPGRYTLIARAAPHAPDGAPPAPPAPGRGSAAPSSLFAMVDVDVNGRDVTDLTVNLAPGATIAGRVAYEGPAPAPGMLPRLTLAPAGPADAVNGGGRGGPFMGMPSTATANPDGSFLIQGIAPGRYRLNAFIPSPDGRIAPLTLKSAMVDGRDMLDDPLECRAGQSITNAVVTLTDRSPEVSGTLSDAAGKPTPDFFIVAFSTDRKYWIPGSRRVAQSRPDNTGAFKIAALPPGEYYLSAVSDVDNYQLGNPAFLEPLIGGSVKITLADGEKKVQNLKIAGGG